MTPVAPGTTGTPRTPGPSESASPSAMRTPRRKPRKPAARGTPRLLPWESGMTRLWPGTKIACLTLLSTALLLWPRWAGVATVGAAFLVASLVARVPGSAIPRLPVWFWAGLFGGLVGSWLGGNPWIFIRSILVATWIVWGSFLLLWTTPIERVTPALRVFLAPLRAIRLPVDEWATAMGFAVRGLPSLRDQTSSVVDAAKLRAQGKVPETLRDVLRVGIDTTTASLSAASRRAADTGRAMTLRGGVPPVPREKIRVGWRDALTLVVAVGAAGATYALRGGWPQWVESWWAGLGVVGWFSQLTWPWG